MTFDTKDILEMVPMMVQCLDSEGRLVYANAAWRGAMGYAPEQIRDLDIRSIVVESSLAPISQALQATFEGREVAPLQLHFVREDGTVMWLEGTFQLVQDDRAHVAVFLHELDVQTRISRLQERFFEVSLDLLCVADFDGYFKLLNPAWESVLGYTTEEMLSRPFLEFVHPDDREATNAESRKIWSGDCCISFQNRYLHKDGGYRWMRWVATSDVDTRTILACAHDITEEIEQKKILTEALEAAKEASVAKSSFLANMSHELRTPLNSVIGFSELLSDETFGPLNPKQGRYIENIMSNGRHLLDLINDILDLSKVEAGEMDFELKMLDLTGLSREALDKLRPLAEKKELKMHLEVETEMCQAIGDESRTRQILFNLLSNAIKFTPQQGEIGIRLRGDSPECLITVWDTGQGLEKQDLSRVFDRFKQIDSGFTRKQSGTGLGLALCRHFVQEQKGRIWATSEGENKGSQFQFTLPAPKPDVELDHEIVDEDDNSLVLVVEDDPCSSELLTTHLASAGYRTVRAFTGEKALKLATELRPGAITLDLELPDMSGWEVLRALKSSSTTEPIPVIVSSIVDESARGISVEVSDFVPKPLDRSLLLETMMKYLPSGQRRKVLLIDDDPDVLELISKLLESQGIEVYEASGGQQGLQLLSGCQPDAIIVDLNMPEMDGFETIEQIRAHHCVDIPIVVFTSADLSRSEAERLNGHAEKVVPKSSRQDLLKVLRQVFEKESKS